MDYSRNYGKCLAIMELWQCAVDGQVAPPIGEKVREDFRIPGSVPGTARFQLSQESCVDPVHIAGQAEE